jgi:hypothetical protein
LGVRTFVGPSSTFFILTLKNIGHGGRRSVVRQRLVRDYERQQPNEAIITSLAGRRKYVKGRRRGREAGWSRLREDYGYV